MRSPIICATIVLVTVLASPVSADWGTPVPVTELNTSYQESGPWLSNDNLTIYFSRRPDHWRMYQATRSSVESPFTSITPISELNSETENTSYCWASQDGLRMYYTQNELLRTASRVSVVDTWTPGDYLDELNAYGNYNIEDSQLSVDECTIVFASIDSYGNWDMNIATRANTTDPFSNIRPLSELNTEFHDNGASLSADGLSIYFHSDRSGEHNIYLAARASISDLFGTPEVISSLSGFAQPTISMDGQTMLLINPGSNWDIYASAIPEPATIVILGIGGLLLGRSKR